MRPFCRAIFCRASRTRRERRCRRQRRARGWRRAKLRRREAERVTAVFWIALGCALGGAGRYWCSGVVARRFGERFPWGTLFVNVVGSFIIGTFDGLGPDGTGSVDLGVREFVMIGLCGGYTTFSR